MFHNPTNRPQDITPWPDNGHHVAALSTAPTGGTARERRAWANGYQEALADIAERIAESGTDDTVALGAALVWIVDNGGPSTREILGLSRLDSTRKA